jgi:hypothetical protein
MLINILMEESASTRLTLKFLFIFLFSLLTVVSFINSLLTLSTCFIRKIRITICGLYIIIYSIFSFIGIALLEIIAVVALFYNDELNKYPVIHCALIPMFLYLTFNIYLWLSAFIAVERLLIQLFHYSHYRTRKYAIMFLIILFIFLSSASVITALGRTVGKSPIFSTTYYVCSFNRFPNENWKIANKVISSSYVHVITPLALSSLSIVLTITHIIRHKITLTDLERNSWLSLIKQQILKHRDFFIPPLVIIICTLPERLLINIADGYCIEKSMHKFYLRLHIAFDFLLYMPLVLPFFIYIYPSNVYMNQFRKTEIVKWIKLKICSRCCRTSSNIVEGCS